MTPTRTLLLSLSSALLLLAPSPISPRSGDLVYATAASINSANQQHRHQQQRHPHQQHQQQQDYVNQPGDLFDEKQAFQYAQPSSTHEIRCNFENSIERVDAARGLDDITIEKYKQRLMDGLNVTWLRYFSKRTNPERIHRDNGEKIDGLSSDFNDKPQITLHQVGTSDTGWYECRLKWPDIDVIRYFRLPAKITFPFVVDKDPREVWLSRNIHNQKQKKQTSSTTNKSPSKQPNALASHEYTTNITLSQLIATISGLIIVVVVCVLLSLYYGFRFCQTPLHEKNFPNLQTNIPYNRGIIDQENNSNTSSINNRRNQQPDLDNLKIHGHNGHHCSHSHLRQQQHLDNPIDHNNHPSNTISNKNQHGYFIDSPTIFHPRDMYNVDGFITGHLRQSSGNHLAQSINTSVFAITGSKNPSISSSSSSSHSHSDEASTSSSSHGGDTSRMTVYQHTSNTTSTTVPVYDYPNGNNNTNQNHHIIELDPSKLLSRMNAGLNPNKQQLQEHGQNQQLKAPITSSTDHSEQLLSENTCVSNPAYVGLDSIPIETCRLMPIQERDLRKCDLIGSGQFGTVFRYKRILEDGTSRDFVAVKELCEPKKSCAETGRDELLNEIDLMNSIHKHPNVIEVYPCILSDAQNPKLVMEYAELGDLQRYLRACRVKQQSNETDNQCNQISCQDENHPPCRNVTSRELIKFARDIARGMNHVSEQGVIHRDLASRNILLTADKVCKIADFGFARRIDPDSEYVRKSNTVVPVKWMAPEALVDNKFTTKSDVFSFGIVLWEIVTLGATPYEGLTSEEVYKKVTKGERMDKPSHCKEELWSIMDGCWLQDPRDRPSFEELACRFEELLQATKSDYIELDQYNTEANYYNILPILEREEVKL